MISIYNIKPKFQKLLKPILDILYKGGVTANMITWGAILLSAITGVLFWIHPYGKIFLLVPLSLFVRMALNALDGMMARVYAMQSATGEVLNELGDVVSDFFIFFPLILLPGINLYIIVGFLFLSLINEFAGVLGKVLKGERRYDGPMGKSDRSFLVGACCLTIYFWEGLLPLLNYIFLGAILLLILSTGARIKNTFLK